MTHVDTAPVITTPGAKYASALLSLTVLLVTSITAALAGPITLTVLIQLGLLFLGGVVTYIVPLMSGPWAGVFKVGIGVVAAALAAIVPLLTGTSWTLQNTLIVVLAVVNALATQLGVAIRKDPIDAGTAVPGVPSVITNVFTAQPSDEQLTAAIDAVNKRGGVS
jgi:hypothetical protein